MQNKKKWDDNNHWTNVAYVIDRSIQIFNCDIFMHFESNLNKCILNGFSLPLSSLWCILLLPLFTLDMTCWVDWFFFVVGVYFSFNYLSLLCVFFSCKNLCKIWLYSWSANNNNHICNNVNLNFFCYRQRKHEKIARKLVITIFFFQFSILQFFFLSIFETR